MVLHVGVRDGVAEHYTAILLELVVSLQLLCHHVGPLLLGLLALLRQHQLVDIHVHVADSDAVLALRRYNGLVGCDRLVARVV